MYASKKDLKLAFEEAYKKASATEIKLPQDIMLRLYAYYKKASDENIMKLPSKNENLVRNAFKANAKMQVNGISKEEAMQKYIDLVQKHVTD